VEPHRVSDFLKNVGRRADRDGGYVDTENATPLGTTQPHQPVEVLVSRSVPILPPASERPFLTVEEAAAVLGISRTLADSLAREFLTTRSGLPCVRLGSRRIVVPRAALERWTNTDFANPNDAA
jgi:predicted DNA-binding transcriptional regulator AlpA